MESGKQSSITIEVMPFLALNDKPWMAKDGTWFWGVTHTLTNELVPGKMLSQSRKTI